MIQDHQIDTGIALLSGEGSVAGRRHFWLDTTGIAIVGVSGTLGGNSDGLERTESLPR